MKTNIDYIKSQDIIPDLTGYCSEHGYTHFYLIADVNTYRVLGQTVEQALLSTGANIKTILLHGDEIRTDEHFVVQAMVEMTAEKRVFLAVGSGTVTDITRFISHRTGSQFISIPTAPSVDGYTSTVAPMVVGNYKAPIQSHPPIAVFANMPTLCESPKIMIAAGVGDLLGKYTSLVDWKLGNLLYSEPFNESVFELMKKSVDLMVDAIDQVAEGTCDGINYLMDGLVGSGFGMLEFGDSRPASGSEHHIGHFWEMKAILEGKPAVLHGAEVGVATILSAGRYEQIRKMTKADAERCLSGKGLPDHNQLLSEIEIGYGPAAEKIRQIQQPLFQMTQSDLDRLTSQILSKWNQIQALAAEVPPAHQISKWIQTVGGPVEPAQIGLSSEAVHAGLKYGHYLRDRFTVNRLAYWLDLPSGPIAPK